MAAPQLLAPAGSAPAAYAALQYGADAVYLGLDQFSARADAANFTVEQLSELVAFAHAQQPRPRRVYVAINTVIQQAQWPELLRCVGAVADIGADALIVQDLGVAALVRKAFPQLSLHASTQMAVHNLAGAVALRQCGFSRVILARELTMAEIHRICRMADLEIEVFIHGALCYAYSGMCLLSSHMGGRSGNRGSCAYPCRDWFSGSDAASATSLPPGFLFSMKDLAVDQHVRQLAEAGVSSVKIEGRKKKPLWVAAAVAYYRSLLDANAPIATTAEQRADLDAIFSRATTTFFLTNGTNIDIITRDRLGHEGTLIGEVAAVLRGRSGGDGDWLRFTATRALERHDGLHLLLANAAKPYGFALLRMRAAGQRHARDLICTDAGTEIEVQLPPDHPPIAAGTPIACSSSTAVTRRYRLQPLPRPGAWAVRQAVDVDIEITAEAINISATLTLPPTLPGSCRATLHHAVQLDTARCQPTGADTCQRAFARLDHNEFALRNLCVTNAAARFVPASLLNDLRRQVVTELAAQLEQLREARLQRLLTLQPSSSPPAPKPESETAPADAWIIKVDAPQWLQAIADADHAAIAEVIVQLQHRQSLEELLPQLQQLEQQFGGRQRIRLALPVIIRQHEESAIQQRVDALLAANWQRWQISHLSGLQFLHCQSYARPAHLNISADWPMYVLNHAAAAALLEMGLSRFTLSPEDSRANLQQLLPAYAQYAEVIVFQDTPLCISEVCLSATLSGNCNRKPATGGSCTAPPPRAIIGKRTQTPILACQRDCRTVLLRAEPLLLAPKMPELRAMGARFWRADFLWRNYNAEQVNQIWQALRQPQAPVGGHCGNYERGFVVSVPRAND